MKKILSIISGVFMISAVPLSTVACNIKLGQNDFNSPSGFDSTAELINNNKDVVINFEFADEVHYLQVLNSVSSTAVETAKEFYGFNNLYGLKKKINHIKYSFEIKIIENKNVEIVKQIYILK